MHSSRVSRPSEGRETLGECVRAANHTAAQHISQPTSAVLVELKSDRPDRVDSREGLLESLVQWKALGRRVVLTNGCFDLLHAGHVSLLTEAARLGDVLVVGLNTDASVRQLKGPDRPVRHREDRSSLLAALAVRGRGGALVGAHRPRTDP